MEFSRIEKSLESHQVPKVDGRENRKKGKSDEEFRQRLQEEREEKEERESEDKVELSEEEPAAAAESEAQTYRTAPRYNASDAATSLALLGLQMFAAKDAEGTVEGDEATGEDAAGADGETDSTDMHGPTAGDTGSADDSEEPYSAP